MKILSWNVCGFRSICKKGYFFRLKAYKPDVICLQEIKTEKVNLPLELLLLGYNFYANPARFHGTLILTKLKPKRVLKKIGYQKFDSEGRFLRLDFPNFILINVYMPHGGRFKERMEYKLKSYEHLLDYLEHISNRNVILAGDFNIAHKPVDLARPKENLDHTMFTQEERKMLDELIKLGFVDTFRKFHKLERSYTWWLRAYDAREKDVGWRIDYIFVSKSLESRLRDAFILSKVKGSDHCPVGIEIEIPAKDEQHLSLVGYDG